MRGQRATGGLMTMLTAPGAGTNTATGSAHQDAFDELAASEAEQIANLLQEKLFAPVLDQWHPGQPHLVEFVMRRPDSDNAAGSVANIATLAQNGYRTPDEQVAELTGLQVRSSAVAQPPHGASSAALNSLRVRYAPTMLYPPARAAFERALNAKVTSGTESPRTEAAGEPPLNEEELEALRFLGGGLNPAQVAADAEYMAKAMRESTIDPSPLRGSYAEAGDLRMESSAAEPQEEEETVTNAAVRVFKRDNMGRFAATGAVLRKNKGGRGSKGNPKSLRIKSNTPLKAARLAKPQAQVDATEHALKTREGGGGVVKGAAWVKGKRLDVKGGSSDTGGASHMTKHYKPGDTSRRKAAKDTILGRKQKDRTEVASVGKKNKVILADKGDHLEPVTTRRKTDND